MTRTPSAPLASTLFAALLLAAPSPARAEAPLLAPLVAEGAIAPPWHVAGLPRQGKPFTRFTPELIDDAAALRIDADDSYGNLVHPLRLARPALHLVWRWRVDRFVEAADLRTREGDDTALKVCVLFDMALDRVPFVERQLLRLARSRTDESLPAATICYVWDARLSAGTVLENAYTPRMRYIVLQGGGESTGQWVTQRRDVAADFQRLFGAESVQLPPIIGVAIGADADNTHGRSTAHVADLVLEP